MRDNRTASFHYESLNDIGNSFLKPISYNFGRNKNCTTEGLCGKILVKDKRIFLVTFTDLNNKDKKSFIQCSIEMLTILREN